MHMSCMPKGPWLYCFLGSESYFVSAMWQCGMMSLDNCTPLVLYSLWWHHQFWIYNDNSIIESYCSLLGTYYFQKFMQYALCFAGIVSTNWTFITHVLLVHIGQFWQHFHWKLVCFSEKCVSVHITWHWILRNYHVDHHLDGRIALFIMTWWFIVYFTMVVTMMFVHHWCYLHDAICIGMDAISCYMWHCGHIWLMLSQYSDITITYAMYAMIVGWLTSIVSCLLELLLSTFHLSNVWHETYLRIHCNHDIIVVANCLALVVKPTWKLYLWYLYHLYMIQVGFANFYAWQCCIFWHLYFATWKSLEMSHMTNHTWLLDNDVDRHLPYFQMNLPMYVVYIMRCITPLWHFGYLWCMPCGMSAPLCYME